MIAAACTLDWYSTAVGSILAYRDEAVYYVFGEPRTQRGSGNRSDRIYM